MAMAVVAAMFAMASCACCNNSEQAAEPAAAGCTDGCGCGGGACCDEAACAVCDSTATCEQVVK